MALAGAFAAVWLAALSAAPAAAASADSAELSRAETLADQASELEKAGRYDAALPLTQETLAIREKALGANDPEVAKSLNNLAALYVDMGRPGDAEPLYRRALAILETARGADDPDVATLLDNLGNLYQAQARYADAEAVLKRALAIREKAFGADSPKAAHSLNDLAALYVVEGRYPESEDLFRRSLAITEKALGPDDAANAPTLNNLAFLYAQQGRYADAEAFYQRCLAVVQKTLGPDHPDLGRLLSNLAQVYVAEARFGDAEPLLKRALAIREKALGPDHPDVGDTLEDLAQLYYLEGRNAEAEPLYKRSLELHEKALGPDNPAVATTLSNLAAVLAAEGRRDAAEQLYRRSLAIREKALGPDHPDVAITLNNLGELYRVEQRYSEAEPLYRRAIAIWEKSVGPQDADLGRALNNLADVARREQRFSEAEALFKRSLNIFERAFGKEHPMVAMNLNNLAALYEDEGRNAEAEPLYRRALAIDRKIFGPENHDVAYTLWNLAALSLQQQRIGEARSLAAQAVEIVGHRISAADGAQSSGDRAADQREFRGLFLLSVALAPAQNDVPALPLDDSFRIAQLAQASSAARAVAGMAARFAAGSDALADIVRQRQDLAQQWLALDQALVQAASLPQARRDAAAQDRLRQRIADSEAQLAALDTHIAHDFPAYAELSNPKPLDLAATQALLAPDEALVVYLVGEDRSWLWAVRRDRAQLYPLAIGGDALAQSVIALRERLDPDQNPDLLPFDLERAHALYQAVLAPAEPLLDGARLVFVVPDGALQSLPLAVLPTKPAAPAAGVAAYRDVAWFARSYATAVLPSVGALRELRDYPNGARAELPFVGIGDPILGEAVAGDRGAPQHAVASRGAMPDVAALHALPSLPETADELRAVAKSMGAGDGDLYLGERASEPLLRKADLERYRIVEFATHGLMSGDLEGLTEPALVLTPPDHPTPDDDGLLTASKIATLKLDADWVVLSACNTAAADGTPDAGGLSGLAKAFFYAGARSVLVSHWAVPSQATVRLVTETFGELRKHPAIGRAEALRRAEMAMLDGSGPPQFAHPLFWAPFALAGEGGRNR